MMEFIVSKGPGPMNEAVIAKFHRLPEGRYRVRVDNVDKRNLSQNSYFHAVVLPAVREGLRFLGFDEVKTDQDAKDVIKAIFLKKKVTNGFEDIELTRDTSSLTKQEFSTFLDEVIKWASEYLKINIPEPNKQLEL